MLSKCPAELREKVYRNELRGLVSKLFDLIKKEKAEEGSEAVNKSLEGYLTLLKHLIGF